MFRTGLASSNSVLRRALRKWGSAVVVAAGLATGALGSTAAQARGPDPDPAPAVAAVARAALPAEAQTAYRQVLAGGPFSYPKDGIVFGNRERLLPSKPRGHYREYTVRTPGSHDRGARRIVCGGNPPPNCYYTDDHYASFRRIAP